MRVIPPGLDFSNLKIAAPPDPWDLMNATGSLKGSGSGTMGSKPRRSSNASSSWAQLAAGGGSAAAGEEAAAAAPAGETAGAGG